MPRATPLRRRTPCRGFPGAGCATRPRCACAARSRWPGSASARYRPSAGHGPVSWVATTSIAACAMWAGSAPPARRRCPTRPRPRPRSRSTSPRFWSTTTIGNAAFVEALRDAPADPAEADEDDLAFEVSPSVLVGNSARVVGPSSRRASAERESIQRRSGATAAKSSGLSDGNQRPGQDQALPSAGIRPSEAPSAGEDEREFADLRQAGAPPSAPCSTDSGRRGPGPARRPTCRR